MLKCIKEEPKSKNLTKGFWHSFIEGKTLWLPQLKFLERVTNSSLSVSVAQMSNYLRLLNIFCLESMLISILNTVKVIT